MTSGRARHGNGNACVKKLYIAFISVFMIGFFSFLWTETFMFMKSTVEEVD